MRDRSPGPERWILRNAVRMERVRLAVIGLIMVLYAAVNVIGYRDTYSDAASRQQFAAAFQRPAVPRVSRLGLDAHRSRPPKATIWSHHVESDRSPASGCR